MADRARTMKKLVKGIYEAWEAGEVTVSLNDTVTMSNLYSAANPYTAVFFKMSDGSEMTNTHVAGTNVCTITGAGTDVKCLYFTYGRKA